MFDIFPISLLIIGIAGALYTTSNHISEFENDDDNAGGLGVKKKLAGLIKRLPLDSVKAQSLFVSQKMLHRTRIFLLKTDNHLMRLIGKISEKEKAANGAGQEKSGDDFWKDLADKSGNDSEERPLLENNGRLPGNPPMALPNEQPAEIKINLASAPVASPNPEAKKPAGRLVKKSAVKKSVKLKITK